MEAVGYDSFVFSDLDKGCAYRSFIAVCTSLPECPTQLHGNEVALWRDAGLLRAQDKTLPTSVPHYKEIVPGLDPTRARILSHVLRFGIVLNETR